jgi:hypothetical protein
MCNLNNQTFLLLDRPPIIPPAFIQPLINAYVVTNPIHTLDFGVFAEPYYGDFNSCSAVLITHNPGQAAISQKGPGSPFDNAISLAPNPREINYYNLSISNSFPNAGTVRWVNNKNNEINNLFGGLINFEERLFIRDLIPYHGQVFGSLPMLNCVDYLYEFFFCQVINSSINSELYRYLNRDKSKKKSTIILARGSAWKEAQGLISIGWDFVGRIYSNCYVYKANFNKIKEITNVQFDKCNRDILSHNIYIIVVTPKKGGRFVIYKTKRGLTTDFDLVSILNNYETINDTTNEFYIKHTEEMDNFMDVLR